MTTRAPSIAGTSRVMHDYRQSNASVVVSTNSGSSSAARVPPLTPEERKLLCDSNGCYKCRIPYTDNSALTCTNGFPNVSTYKTLTLEDVNKAATCCSSKKINAITSPLAEFSDVTNTMNVGAIHSQSPIAMCSSVLSSGDNDFTDSECVSDFFAPHVYWPAVIHGPSVISEPIQTLIDCGSPTVLIKESVADQLGLRCFRLPQPVPLGTAWGTGRRVAEEWVNLRLSAPDFLFSACVVRTIVAPQLCESVILGNTFHVANKLSINPEVSAVIYKPTGRNLLLPPPPCAPSDTRTDNQRLRDNRRKRELQQEEAGLQQQYVVSQHRDVIREMNLNFNIEQAAETPEEVVASI